MYEYLHLRKAKVLVLPVQGDSSLSFLCWQRFASPASLSSSLSKKQVCPRCHYGTVALETTGNFAPAVSPVWILLGVWCPLEGCSDVVYCESQACRR